MKTIRFKSNIKAFLYKNWFNLGLGCFIAFMLIEKDFSINFRLTDPKPGTDAIKTVPDEPVADQPNTKKYSFQGPATSTQKGSIIDQFPGYQSSSKEATPAPVDPLVALRQIDESQIGNFLQRFGNVAGNEMKKFGIPASIILGQAMLGSAAGTNQLAIELNNFFGQTCTNINWSGATAQLAGQCYPKFETAWNAFREHSLLLSSGFYSHLTNLDPKDYNRWAKGLEMSGYHATPGYGQQLINVIEEYQLNRFDQ
ncbi:MAG: glucosaminidase domain-containing protein [Bacteroidota bacterium]